MNSILTVTTAASSYDLTALATVKSELGITDNSENDKLRTLDHAGFEDRGVVLQAGVRAGDPDRDLPAALLGLLHARVKR
jgi:hypothetical protein